MTTQWTVGEVLSAARKFLSEKETPEARLQAEQLLAHSLNLTRFDLYTQYDRPLNKEERDRYRRLLKERSNGRPLQHLTGRQAFRRLTLKMAPGVFIPRPETEILVETILSGLGKGGPPKILEIGTGSGAICVSLAVEVPGSRIWTVDISEPALDLARANAESHGVGERITFCRGDLFAPIDEGLRFDALAANPPYVPSGELARLATEVRDHDPREALDGGELGLDFFKRISAGAPTFLRPGGLIAFEVGIGQAPAVAAILGSSGFGDIAVTKDYAGIERVITGRLTNGGDFARFDGGLS